MRFRQLPFEHTCTIDGDRNLYVKIDDENCVYLDDAGKPQLRKFQGGTIVLDGGKLQMPLESLNKGGVKQTVGPNLDSETMVRYRVRGENGGGKDIYRMVRVSQIDAVGKELGAVDIKVGAKKREIVAASKELHKEQTQHANEFLARLAAIRIRKAQL